jgi:hypothetical protein
MCTHEKYDDIYSPATFKLLFFSPGLLMWAFCADRLSDWCLESRKFFLLNSSSLEFCVICSDHDFLTINYRTWVSKWSIVCDFFFFSFMIFCSLSLAYLSLSLALALFLSRYHSPFLSFLFGFILLTAWYSTEGSRESLPKSLLKACSLKLFLLLLGTKSSFIYFPRLFREREKKEIE